MQTHTLHVDQENSSLRLDIFITKNLPGDPTRSFVKRIFESQNILVNGKKAKLHYKVAHGDEITIQVPDIEIDHIEPKQIPLDIFYEDSDIIIINKPCGMLVHPAKGYHTDTLVNALLYYCENLSNVNEPHRPGIVHRLDRDTSGLIIIAKNNVAHARLAWQFEKHTVKKQYIAVVEGLIEFDEGIVDASLGRHPKYHEKKAVVFYDAKEAQTAYRVIARSGNRSLVALFPRTGRTHQLRVHMAYLGHPVLGDEKYGKKDSFNRLALHAQSIAFLHPRTKKLVEFSSVAPKEFFEACQARC